MRFEKWQALGNDYLIVEEPVDAATRPRAVRPPHRRRRRRRARARAPDEPGFVARLRIFNPDGSEAELSGNGAREAIMYLHRRGWTDGAPVLDPDGRRRDPPDGPRRAHLPRRHGPRAARRRRARSRASPSSSSAVGNPQCAIRVATRDELEALDLPAIGPPIEHDARFPDRTNVSFWTELEPDRIRARIFERGVGETMSSGTGATGAAIAHVLRGGDSPVTVRLDGGELDVDVGEDLHVDLTGWAVPVFTRRAELERDLPDRVAVGRAAVAVALVEPLRLLERGAVGRHRPT